MRIQINEKSFQEKKAFLPVFMPAVNLKQSLPASIKPLNKNKKVKGGING